MSIKVRYFASLKEFIGREQDECQYQPEMTAQTIWDFVVPEKKIPLNTLVAINMQYENLEATVADGDEVAFFPPVTGG